MLSVLESWQFFSEKPIGLTRNLRRSFDYSIIKTTTELLIGKKHKVQAWSRVESSLNFSFEFWVKLGTFFSQLECIHMKVGVGFLKKIESSPIRILLSESWIFTMIVTISPIGWYAVFLSHKVQLYFYGNFRNLPHARLKIWL